MFELTALVILIVSFLGIAVILIKKNSAFNKLEVFPESRIPSDIIPKEQIAKAQFLKSLNFLKPDFWNIFIQKILSKIRVVSLKIESKSSKLLEGMREKTKKRKEKENEGYWDKIKKTSKKSLKNKKES